MGYRNKEDCLREAERLGLDVAGMSWAQLQKAVSDALWLETHAPMMAAQEEPKTEKTPVEPMPAPKPAQVDLDEAALKQFFGQNIMHNPVKNRLVAA